MERSMRASLSLAVILVVACTPKSPEQRFVDSAMSAQVTFMDTDTLDPETGVYASCMFEKVQAHSDGEALVREFLVRDARGDFMSADEWFNLATDCVGHEPGPDSHALIAGYQVEIGRPNDTTLLAIVSERSIGWVSYGEHGDPHLSIEPAKLVDTLRVRRTKFGWRVQGPALRQHVSLSSPRMQHIRTRFADTLRVLGYLH
jgi:hypothetical protein